MVGPRKVNYRGQMGTCAASIVLAVICTIARAAAQQPLVTAAGEAVAPYEVRGDVRNLPKLASSLKVAYFERNTGEGPPNTKQPPPNQLSAQSINIPLAPMPSATQNFAGLSHNDFCTGGQCGQGWPPDTNGDVGPNHYIEAVNSAYAIYSKTGTLLASFTEDQLWSSGGSNPCNGNSQGDPVVIHDQLADRWILTHFAFAVSGNTPVAPFYQCIAVSKTSDPVAGGWWLYPLQMDPGGTGQPPSGTMNDYPKFGIWPDCLYMAANEFSGNTFVGTAYASFSRSDLESGATLHWSLGFLNNASDPFTMIPSNLLGSSAGAMPPAGTPNYFVSESQTAFAFEVRKFTAGPNCGAGGTLSAATNVSQASYTVPGVNVPQPNTTNTLDAIDDRIMQKVQYRKVGSTESLWIVHNVQSTTDRPQWAQLNVTGGTIATTPVQQQIYAPDTTLYRWMGSIAADNAGNVVLGYSTSNATSPNFPSIAYAGRLATDTLNQLPQSETQLVAGSGSQTNSCGGAACNRWGDYSAMSVDPSDDCTFWYTTEYYSSQTNGTNGNWQTRIGSFKFPACTPIGPTSTPTMSPTASPTSSPTSTPTSTSTATVTATRTPTATPTMTPTNTPTSLPTSTPTNTSTATVTATLTPTATPTVSPTNTSTSSPTSTPTNTSTATVTATQTSTNTPTTSPTITPTSSPTSTPTNTSTATVTATQTSTNTPTTSPTNTPTSSPTVTPTDTSTATVTATLPPTETPTITPTAPPTSSPTATQLPSVTATPSATGTPTTTPTQTPTATTTGTPTVTPTLLPTITPTVTPEDSGVVPPDANTGKCEDLVALHLKQLSACTRRCQTKQADAARTGTSFDEEACEQGTGTRVSCRTAYNTATTRLLGRIPAICPPCLDATAQSNLADLVVSFVENNNGLIYCAGTTSFGGDDPGMVPPDANTGRCEDLVAQYLTKLSGCMMKCQTKQADAALKGTSFDEEACEQGTGRPVSCRTAYNNATTRLLGRVPAICPPCLNATAQSNLADLVVNFVENNNGLIYCAGTTPLSP